MGVFVFLFFLFVYIELRVYNYVKEIDNRVEVFYKIYWLFFLWNLSGDIIWVFLVIFFLYSYKLDYSWKLVIWVKVVWNRLFWDEWILLFFFISLDERDVIFFRVMFFICGGKK